MSAAWPRHREFWLGDHFMGEDFTAPRKAPIRVRVRGTGPVKSIELIRDAAYIHSFAPGRRDVELSYMDEDADRGQHWYYVRVEQEDGELAWSSPIWVRYP